MASASSVPARVSAKLVHLLTSMHGPKHASDEFVNAKTLLDQGYEGRDAALVVGRASEIGEDKLLE